MTKTYNVNVFGAAAATEAFKPLLEKSDFPRIVNVSSGGGSIHKITHPPQKVNLLAYNTSKTALNAVTAYHANTFKKASVICVDPGHSATGLDNYVGGADPREGARIIVRGIIEDRSGELQSGHFYNSKNEENAW